MVSVNWSTNHVSAKYVGASTGAAPIYSGPQVAGTTLGNATNYVAPGALFIGTSTETNNQVVVPFAMTASLLTLRVGANTGGSTVTLSSRKNTAAGNQSLTVATTLTGTFQDATHSDTYAVGDKMNVKIIGPTSGAMTFGTVGWLITADQPADTLMAQVFA